MYNNKWILFPFFLFFTSLGQMKQLIILRKQMGIFKQYFIDIVVNLTSFINFNVFVYMLKSPVTFPLNYKVFQTYKTALESP